MAAVFLATLAIPLSDPQKLVLGSIASELRFLLSENEVADVVQIRLHELGYKSMQMFSVIADTRPQLRDMVTRDIVNANEVGLTALSLIHI